MEKVNINKVKSTIPKISQDQLVGEQKVIKKLICDICKHMLVNPQMCNKCMNIWCEKCCNDKQYLPKSRCPNQCDNMQFLNSPPLLDELFKIIKIKCFFHVNKEEPLFICPKILDYNEYSSHYYTCEFGYEICEIQECQKMIKRKDMHEHKNVCPSRELLMKMVKEAHMKTIQQGNTLNQITQLTEVTYYKLSFLGIRRNIIKQRVKKENEKLSIELLGKSQKLEQVQTFQLNQCRKCLHIMKTQNK